MGKIILQHPDKPKFLEGHVQRIEVGWDDTKQKAQDRLTLLTETRDAWVGYAENNETIASEFEKAEDEIKKVKKRFNLASALEDLKRRQDLYNGSNNTITGLFESIGNNFKCMCITLPEDKKKILEKEIKAVNEKLEVTGRFKDKVAKIESFCTELQNFDNSLKAIDSWKDTATAELEDIKNELNRITKYVTDLQARTKTECDKYSEDVKYWAEYRTGIKEFSPWLASSEGACTEGLSKPSNLDEVKALNEKVAAFAKSCENYLKVLMSADAAAKKMTTHDEADKEVATLKGRFDKVKAVSMEWTAKVDTLLKEWQLLDNPVTELNSWVAKDKSAEGENQFSLEKMESPLGELKNIFKQKEKLVDGLHS